MTRIVRSAAFKRQLVDLTAGYRARASSNIALKFVDQVDSAIRFIATKPLACPIYTRIEHKDFRKWSLQDFPTSIFFRFESQDIIILEALYAHRMNISARLSKS
ncbi:type II toxin-antitoxin system RelE/ParE family toxin [Thalassospira sp. TSL5-1]|uniref:type II toxin-antitoxin system RelE/ParE family toxin n=1 Tax=Thalassospira sp. TSL5-1 TaxID=1544451 RepID=UPI000938EE21|nr:type II toxin-antitoxin system RelE/ParE family toxin [Thalassospira sp. TSL5-1]OKH87144.1 hypothetical protein LF95_19420 [Thalassospira sp. TSL5-1]